MIETEAIEMLESLHTTRFFCALVFDAILFQSTYNVT